MGNKTIYVSDDDIWEKAKKFAGKDGLSSVIARSLGDYVAARTAQDEAMEKYHFEIIDLSEPDGPTAVIGFEGTKLLSTSFNLIANPFVPSDNDIEADVEIYRTRLGTFVLLAEPTSTEPQSKSVFATYETHRSLRELMSGTIVQCMLPPNRHELLTELTTRLGKDVVTWID